MLKTLLRIMFPLAIVLVAGIITDPRFPSGEGESMLPNFRDGQRALFFKPWRQIQPNDVVLISYGGVEWTKRVSSRSGQYLWLLGDNSANSTDSRTLGWIPKASVIGLCVTRLPGKCDGEKLGTAIKPVDPNWTPPPPKPVVVAVATPWDVFSCQGISGGNVPFHGTITAKMPVPFTGDVEAWVGGQGGQLIVNGQVLPLIKAAKKYTIHLKNATRVKVEVWVKAGGIVCITHIKPPSSQA